jgi:hypothetical protein
MNHPDPYSFSVFLQAVEPSLEDGSFALSHRKGRPEWSKLGAIDKAKRDECVTNWIKQKLLRQLDANRYMLAPGTWMKDESQGKCVLVANLPTASRPAPAPIDLSPPQRTAQAAEGKPPQTTITVTNLESTVARAVDSVSRECTGETIKSTAKSAGKGPTEEEASSNGTSNTLVGDHAKKKGKAAEEGTIEGREGLTGDLPSWIELELVVKQTPDDQKGPRISVSPENGWKLTPKSTLADLKAKLQQLYRSPAWAMELSWNGASLQGKADRTLGELGIPATQPNNARENGISDKPRIHIDSWYCLEDRCSVHGENESPKSYVCQDCFERMCAHCAVNHIQAFRNHSVVKLTPGEAGKSEHPLSQLFVGGRGIDLPASKDKLKNRGEAQKKSLSLSIGQLNTQLQKIRQAMEELQKQEATVKAELTAAEGKLSLLESSSWMYEPLDYTLSVWRSHLKCATARQVQPHLCIACGSKVGSHPIALHGRMVDLCAECVERFETATSEGDKAIAEKMKVPLEKLQNFTTANTLPRRGDEPLGWLDGSQSNCIDWACEGIIGLCSFPTDQTSTSPLRLEHVKWVVHDGLLDAGGETGALRQLNRVLKACPNVSAVVFPPGFLDKRTWFTLVQRSVNLNGVKVTEKDYLRYYLASNPSDAASWLRLGLLLSATEKVGISNKTYAKKQCYFKALADPQRFTEWFPLAAMMSDGEEASVTGGIKFTKRDCLRHGLAQSPDNCAAWKELASRMGVNDTVTIGDRSMKKRDCVLASIDDPKTFADWGLLASLIDASEEIPTAKGLKLTKKLCLREDLNQNSDNVSAWNELGALLGPNETALVSGKPVAKKDCLINAAVRGPSLFLNWKELALMLTDSETAQVSGVGTTFTKKQCLERALEQNPDDCALWQTLSRLMGAPTETVHVAGKSVSKKDCLLKAMKDRNQFQDWLVLLSLVQPGEELMQNNVKVTRRSLLFDCLASNPAQPSLWLELGKSMPSAEFVMVGTRRCSKKDCLLEALQDAGKFTEWLALSALFDPAETVTVNGKTFTKKSLLCEALARGEGGPAVWGDLARLLGPNEEVTVLGRSYKKHECFAKSSAAK